MDTARQLLLESDNGSDRLKFEYDFNYTYDTKATFTCRQCGKHEYRNGEFQTIKMGDIFTHITNFPSSASPGGDNLCTQCLDANGEPYDISRDVKPSKLQNNNTYNNNNNNNNVTNINNTSTNHAVSVSNNDNGIIQQSDLCHVSLASSSGDPNTLTFSVLSNTLYGENPELPGNTIVSNHDSSNFNTSSLASEAPKYTISMVNSVLDPSQSAGDPANTTYIISHTQLPQQAQVIKQESSPASSSLPPLTAGSIPLGNSIPSATAQPLSAPGLSTMNSNNNVNNKECQVCKKTFKSNKIAQLHYQRVHEKVGKYCCHICGIRFSYRGSLDSHLASHTTPEVTHNCPTCGQKFKEKSNLTNHMKIHSDNPKKFLCEFCPSGFSKRVNLRYHMKRKHPDEVLSISNPGSGSTSSNNNNNNNNINSNNNNRNNQNNSSNNNNNNTQTGGMSAPMSQPNQQQQLPNMSHNYPPLNNSATTKTSSKDKPQGNFKCEHCGRTFLFKNNLKAHLRTHTRDKKYTCEVCEKSFIYKESLKNHMLLHSNELPYLCDVCGKKFRDRSNRRKHVKNVHKYMFMNGDASTAGPAAHTSNLVKNGDNVTGVYDPTRIDSSNSGHLGNEPIPPKKKRNNNKKNISDTVGGDSGNKRTIIKSTNNNNSSAKKRNSGMGSGNAKGNNNQSVIVSTASNVANSLGVGDQDRKIIMSPSPKSNTSPLEYSHLPVTVHVPASPAGGGLHQHYVSTNHRNHNVIVKASASASSPTDMTDMYHRSQSQNVIVYPKSKGTMSVVGDYTQQGTVISHNNLLPPHPSQPQHVSQPQYYTDESYEPRNAQPTYLTLPLSSLTSSNSDVPQASTMVYEFAHPSTQQGPNLKIETDTSDPNSLQQPPTGSLRYQEACGDNPDTVQYSTAIYASTGGEPSYHLHHSDHPEHQYWTVAPANEATNPTNVSPPYTAPSSVPANVPVSYESPITAASNVLNVPSYAQADIVDPNTSNFTFYKELSQFDFSYL